MSENDDTKKRELVPADLPLEEKVRQLCNIVTQYQEEFEKLTNEILIIQKALLERGIL